MARLRIRKEVAHAAKVAPAASLFVGIVYAACVAVLDQVVESRLTAAVDARLTERLSDVREVGLQGSGADDDDIDATPVYLWRLAGRARSRRGARARPRPSCRPASASAPARP